MRSSSTVGSRVPIPTAKPGRRGNRGLVAFLAFVIGSVVAGGAGGALRGACGHRRRSGRPPDVDEWDAMTVDVPFDSKQPCRNGR